MTSPLDLYPISENAPDQAVSASGMPLADLTLDAVISERIGAEDIRISADVLRLQASIARDAGRDRLALNLERAADLVSVPQDLILDTYEMLRPGRIPEAHLLKERAELLRREYGAHTIAALIDEAVAVYERRNLFRRRY
ncbi:MULTISPECIES: diol dehydratase small subunit [unclassified Mesorhizobium]|uniref:diol dehydratase small subunit n=1 Tax=unclassified Mesorhizobium TaxID=325217 RepID=UPI0003CFC4E6|nr:MULTISPECIES: diol dehydratase small subunit [unclassified Mesorhizobium]ESZ20109.1 glycerol dehydratase [Mesorhizobium sp. L48C026A00]RWO02306.1 MAG: glycerol dehydratase [Mesorhizobium sp.]RWO51820.1 MAG: glycerol dehydratase [Mesorhizobium sp.]RWO56894.1 MAG: glycerol dehydratase [Mesorhizobium sp.]RWO84055.1 MAG: glycerol dehydratase [Mesorhizobium sp.]